MINSIRVTAVSALFAFSTVALAVNHAESVDEIPVLKQESQHAVSVKRISSNFLRSHYKSITLDDALSEKVYDRYMRSLDSNRNVFLDADVQKFKTEQDHFDEAIEMGDLDIAYQIFHATSN